MLNWLNRYFVRYNFFISICSLALLAYFSVLTHHRVSPLNYIFSFFGTLCVYNLFRLFPSLNDVKQRLSTIAVELILYSSILCVIAFYLIDDNIKYYYLIPIIISLAYKFPIFLKKELRNLAFFKVFIIAFVWISIAAIPLFSDQLDAITKNTLSLLVVAQFFFFIAISIPFDVFDMKKDEMKTIATRFGATKAIYFSLACACVYAIIHVLTDNTIKEKIAHCIVFLITISIISQYKKLKTKTLQYYFLDGLIIFQTLVIYLLH